MSEATPVAQSAPQPSAPAKPPRTSARGLGAASTTAPVGQMTRWMFVYSLPDSDDLHLAAATGPIIRGDAVRLFRQNHLGMGIHEAVPNATEAMIDAKEAEILAGNPNHVPINTVADFLPKTETAEDDDGIEPLP